MPQRLAFPPSPGPQLPQKVLSIQYLRGAAALLVVLHHTLDQFSSFKQYLPTNIGTSGVDIFFVISGFVMSYTARLHNYDRAEFILKRTARIAPMYWIVTLCVVAIMTVAPGLMHYSGTTAGHVLGSLLFVPMHNPAKPLIISPIYRIGWTIEYEVLFYILFSIFLKLDSFRRMIAIGLCFSIISIFSYTAPSAPTPVVFWGYPITFEFLYGSAIAELYFSGGLKRVSKINLVLMAIAGALALCVVGGEHFVEFGVTRPLRPLAFGVPAALIVLSAVGLEQRAGGGRERKLPHFVGDASYSIYLTHIFAVSFVRVAWIKLALPADGAGFALLFIALSLLAGTALGCAAYVAVERPVTAMIRNGLLSYRAKPARGAF